MSATQEVISTSAEVQVTFLWKADRYEYAFTFGEHRLVAVTEDSIETPVFTDLHQQDQLLFLSGMSDDRHWSMSIEPTDKGFALDIAVRAKSSVEKIGSVYEAASPEQWKLTGVAVDETSAPAMEAISDSKQSVVPVGDFNQTPVTIRYRYRIEHP